MSEPQKVTKGGSNPFIIILIIIACILAWVYFDKQGFDFFVIQLQDSGLLLLQLAIIIFIIALLLRKAFPKFW